MDKWKKIKNHIFGFLDIVFIITYIIVVILAILDIFSIFTVVKSELWSKVLVFLFGTVGIVIISDKKRMEEDIKPQIENINEKEDVIQNAVQRTEIIAKDIFEKIDNEMDVKYFPDKTQFYLFLTELILKLPSGSRIDVTSFEKNYNVSYDVGEDIHIESFMKTWTEMVSEGRFLVRQLVHITSTQDYEELNERINLFKNNYNFTVSAIVGLPIVPFFDMMVINQEYIFMGLSNDVSSPNNFSFGFAIKGRELALNFQNYFNVYWSSQFSVLVKDKDEIKKKNLKEVGRYVYDIDHDASFVRFNQMLLALYHINEHNGKIIELLDNLHRFYGNVCYDIMQNEIESKIRECVDFINKRTHNFVTFDRTEAAEIIAKMMFNAKNKIFAVSLDIDGSEFWVADEGESVFQANIDAISKRKVEIQRIFISTKEKKTELKKIMDEQINAGIILYYTEFKQGMGGTFEDFLIIDNEAVLVFTEKTVKISIYHPHIDEYFKKFERIKKLGSKY